LHKLVSYRNEKDLEENKTVCFSENQNDLAAIIKKYPSGHPLNLKARECDIHNDVYLSHTEQAIQKAFAFYEQYSDIEAGKRVLLSIADIHDFVTQDKAAMKKVYALFAQNHPEHPLAEYAKARSQELQPGKSPEDPLHASGIYPNPFNAQTCIRYRVPENSEVVVTIYNSLGQSVKTLVHGNQVAGAYVIQWDGKDDTGNNLASGLYFCRFKIGANLWTHKILLMK
jgi:hypothetical protein